MPNEPAFDWGRLLDTVRDDEPDLYRSWFATLRATPPERGELEIQADDPSQAHYLEDKCRDAFVNAAMKSSGYMLAVRFVCRQVPPSGTLTGAPAALTRIRLSADYTFDQFVVARRIGWRTPPAEPSATNSARSTTHFSFTALPGSARRTSCRRPVARSCSATGTSRCCT